MILVAGLAAAVIVGIAAAFYFSIRAGNGRDKRGRAAGPGRAGASERRVAGSSAAPGSRTGTTRRPAGGGKQVNPGRAATGSSGPYREPADRRGQRGPAVPVPVSAAAGTDDTPADAWPAQARSATRPSREAHATAEASAKARRRVGFRKGAGVDEELWPTEAFGGVTDEQFWDDLASDKPLATTARTAQQNPGTGSRPPGAVRVAESPTAIQPAYAATQPVRIMTAQGPDAARAAAAGSAGQPANPTGQSTGTAAPPLAAAAPPLAAAAPPLAAAPPPLAAAAPHLAAAPPPLSAVAPPNEAGGRRRRSNRADEEDPLTSAAFALRPSGPVDGRSALMSRPPADAAGERSGEPTLDGYGGTAPYPYPATAYGDASSATQSPDTPPYGEHFGYRRPDPIGDPPRQNGSRSRARHASNGHPDRDFLRRPAHQQENGYRTGGYPVGGYPGSGYPHGPNWQNGYPQHGHAGNGYSENGYRVPYDPRHGYRGLTPTR